LADEASGVFFVIEAAYPRVLTPNDDVLALGGGVADFPTDEVRGDQAHERGPTNDGGRTASLTDPLPIGPSGALLSIRSSSPSMGAEATLDA
jgi:hypothetical protein